MNNLTIQPDKTYNPEYSNGLGFSVKGIRPEGYCPKCKKPFKFNSRKMSFLCKTHLTVPQRFMIDIYYNGKRIRRGTTLDGETLRTFAQAHALYMQAEEEKKHKKFDPAKWRAKGKIEYSFDMLICKWHSSKEELMNNNKRAPSYVPKLRIYMRNFFEPCYGNRDVREIFNLDEFTTFISSYRQKGGQSISLKYQKNLTDALQSFFRWLLKKKYITELPDFPDPVEIPEHDPQTITRDIQLKLLECVSNEDKPIFTWLFYQGCRPGEARALMGDCILTQIEPRDAVKYKRTFSGSQLKERTKTKNIRYNYIYPEARAVLPEIIHTYSFVFTHGKIAKKPYSAAHLNKIFRKVLEQFNEKHNTDLRIELYEATKHSFGTQKVNEGISIHELKEWYGHSKIEMTEKYAKVNIVDVFRKHDKVVSIEQAKTRLNRDRQ